MSGGVRGSHGGRAENVCMCEGRGHQGGRRGRFIGGEGVDGGADTPG